jgi:hypothetical protein
LASWLAQINFLVGADDLETPSAHRHQHHEPAELTNMDLRDPEGNTAVHWAFAMGFNDLADFLLAKGANDRIANNQGFTCRNWRRPESGDGSTDTLSAHGPNLQPNSVSPSRYEVLEVKLGQTGGDKCLQKSLPGFPSFS